MKLLYEYITNITSSTWETGAPHFLQTGFIQPRVKRGIGLKQSTHNIIFYSAIIQHNHQ